MDKDILAAVGRCLHGDKWRIPLSRDLAVGERSVRRWATHGAPDSIAGELIDLLDKREAEINDVRPDLVAISKI